MHPGLFILSSILTRSRGLWRSTPAHPTSIALSVISARSFLGQRSRSIDLAASPDRLVWRNHTPAPYILVLDGLIRSLVTKLGHIPGFSPNLGLSGSDLAHSIAALLPANNNNKGREEGSSRRERRILTLSPPRVGQHLHPHLDGWGPMMQHARRLTIWPIPYGRTRTK